MVPKMNYNEACLYNVCSMHCVLHQFCCDAVGTLLFSEVWSRKVWSIVPPCRESGNEQQVQHSWTTILSFVWFHILYSNCIREILNCTPRRWLRINFQHVSRRLRRLPLTSVSYSNCGSAVAGKRWWVACSRNQFFAIVVQSRADICVTAPSSDLWRMTVKTICVTPGPYDVGW